jgi:hypothetical protein
MNKIFVEEIWYIENFLTEKEISILIEEADKKEGWYKTMRSQSIRNKWYGLIQDLDEEGSPTSFEGVEDDEKLLMFKEKESGIFDRLANVLPETLIRSSTYQSFWPIDEFNPTQIGGAFLWHYENKFPQGMTAAWSLYLNDDYEGGILEFMNKPYKFKFKKGTLVSIPLTEEYTHRVGLVTKGVRHTLYGGCFEDVNSRPISSMENC